MTERKRKAGRPRKPRASSVTAEFLAGRVLGVSLRDRVPQLCKETGFSPSRMLWYRCAQAQQQIAEWDSALASGAKPPEFMNMNFTDINRIVGRERAELAAMALKLMPYEVPTLASIEANVSTSERRVISAEPMSADEWEATYCLEPAGGTAKDPD